MKQQSLTPGFLQHCYAFSRKSIIHTLLISANNKHLVKGRIIGINTIVSFSVIVTILLSVITHTKVFINWKMMLLKII